MSEITYYQLASCLRGEELRNDYTGTYTGTQVIFFSGQMQEKTMYDNTVDELNLSNFKDQFTVDHAIQYWCDYINCHVKLIGPNDGKEFLNSDEYKYATIVELYSIAVRKANLFNFYNKNKKPII